MRFNRWFVFETKRRRDMALSELKVLETDTRALDLQIERITARRNELEYILAEIQNKREQSLRIQKTTCWAVAGELH